MMSVKSAVFIVLLLGSSLCRQPHLATGLEKTHQLSPLGQAQALTDKAWAGLTIEAMDFIGVKPVPEVNYQNFITSLLTNTNPLVKQALDLGLDKLQLINKLEVHMDISPEEFKKIFPRMIEEYKKINSITEDDYFDPMVKKVIAKGPFPLREKWQYDAFQGVYTCEYRLRAKESETKQGAYHLATYYTCIWLENLKHQGLNDQIIRDAEWTFKNYAYMVMMRDN